MSEANYSEMVDNQVILTEKKGVLSVNPRYIRRKRENTLAESMFKPFGRKNRLIARSIVRKQLKAYRGNLDASV